MLRHRRGGATLGGMSPWMAVAGLALLMGGVAAWNVRVAMERIRRLEEITHSEIKGEGYRGIWRTQPPDKKA